jgi:hypothetical protein
MNVYANDQDEEYPKAGPPNSVWSDKGFITKFEADNPVEAFGGNQTATITSCWYLLVKYAESPPKQFVCKGDYGIVEMKLSLFGDKLKPQGTDLYEFPELWDFADNVDYAPGQLCSYSLHDPFQAVLDPSDEHERAKPATPTGNPDAPIAADRNPVFDKNANLPGGGGGYWENQDGKGTDVQWLPSPEGGFVYYDPSKVENSACHQRDGQNVLFNDGRVSFELTPNCGVDKDNIWKYWTTRPPDLPDAEEKQWGQEYPWVRDVGQVGCPVGIDDAWLINERNHKL